VRFAADPFVTDVKAAAALAPVHAQLIAIADAPRRAVPEIQRDPMPNSRSAVAVKDLAAPGIGAGQNELSPYHRRPPSRRIVADELAIRPHGISSPDRDFNAQRDRTLEPSRVG
jgi:hypothetical protein